MKFLLVYRSFHFERERVVVFMILFSIKELLFFFEKRTSTVFHKKLTSFAYFLGDIDMASGSYFDMAENKSKYLCMHRRCAHISLSLYTL